MLRDMRDPKELRNGDGKRMEALGGGLGQRAARWSLRVEACDDGKRWPEGHHAHQRTQAKDLESEAYPIHSCFLSH